MSDESRDREMEERMRVIPVAGELLLRPADGSIPVGDAIPVQPGDVVIVWREGYEFPRLRLLESALACGCLAFCEPCPECDKIRGEVDGE